jgi:STIP1 family protein 1
MKVPVNHFVGQAQLQLNHPNEALSSALTAYEICSRSVHQTSSAFAISGFVVKCKRAKWDRREKERLQRRNELLGELEEKLLQDRNNEISAIELRAEAEEIGRVAAQEETVLVEETTTRKIDELRNAFAISDPNNLEKRVCLPN